MDCVDAGQMHNTTATIARSAAGNTAQPKGTSDGQYRFRVCVPDDVPTDDFRRPHGVGGGAAPPPPPWSQAQGPPGQVYGAETPMPGREREYETFMAQNDASAAMPAAPPPPPIDADRRSRSPGLQVNFFDKPLADFKRPHGMG